MIIFSPIFAINYYLTFKLARRKLSTIENKRLKIGIFLILIIFCLLLVMAIINYRNELINSLGGPPTDPESRIYRFGWFNQYTNSMYFNIYTFLITHIIAVIIGLKK